MKQINWKISSAVITTLLAVAPIIPTSTEVLADKTTTRDSSSISTQVEPTENVKNAVAQAQTDLNGTLSIELNKINNSHLSDKGKKSAKDMATWAHNFGVESLNEIVNKVPDDQTLTLAEVENYKQSYIDDIQNVLPQVETTDYTNTINNFMSNFSTTSVNMTKAQLNQMDDNPLALLNKSGDVGTYGTYGKPDTYHFGLIDNNGTINGLAQLFYKSGDDAKATAVDMWTIADDYQLKSTVKYGDESYEVTNDNQDAINTLWTKLKQYGGNVTETLELQDKSDNDKTVGTTTLTLHVTDSTTPAPSVSGGGSSSTNDVIVDKPAEKPAPTISATEPVTGVVHIKPSYTVLYTKDGKEIAGRVLPAGTDWQTDGKITLDDGRVLYRVADNEYVLDSVVDFTENNLEVTPVPVGVFTVTQPGYLTLQKMTDKKTFVPVPARLLIQNSAWKYDQKAVWNGQIYYRVATNEWVTAVGGNLSK